MQHMLKFGLSVSLMDRELFVKKVSEFLEQYRNDPEQMEKVASGLYHYLEEIKSKMDMKDAVSSAVAGSNLPGSDDIHQLTVAIENLTREIQQQKQSKS